MIARLYTGLALFCALLAAVLTLVGVLSYPPLPACSESQAVARCHVPAHRPLLLSG